MLLKILFLAAITTVLSYPFNSDLDQHWQLFKKTYDKKYDASEEGARRMIFEENIQYIEQHNLQADLGKYTYRLGITKFADLSHSEYVKTISCLLKGDYPNPSKGSTFVPPSEVPVPDEIDWVEKGFVTDVKNQGACGSCYAFAGVATLESQHKKATGELVVLSEQNIVDCTVDAGNKGCDGGMPINVIEWVAKNHGIDTSESYPYEAAVEKCRFKEDTIGGNCSAATMVAGGNEEVMKGIVAVVGPVAVGMDAGRRKLQLYTEGVYDDEECTVEGMNHAVTVVGYGILEGQEYWKVKNSWGTEWGMKGYFLIARNKNMCGIGEQAVFPIV